MRVVRLSAVAGPDGVIRLSIPVDVAGGEYELAVVLAAKPAVNGTAPARQKTPEELGWPPGFFENVIGSIDDDSFVRPPQPALDPPVSLE